MITESKTSKQLWIEGTSRESKYYAEGYSGYVNENKMRGVIILIRHGSGLIVKNAYELSPDILRLDVYSGVNHITVFGVYGTSRYDDEQFFINLRTHILEAENNDIIVLGDLNISHDKVKDLRGYTTDPHWRSRTVQE